MTSVMTDSERAGYGDDKLSRIIAWLRGHPTTTLASGEGALLLAENDRLRDDLQKLADWADWAKGEMERMRAAAKDSMDHYTDARAEIDRLRTETRVEINWLYQRAERAERILAGLREPSEKVVDAVHGIELREEWYARAQLHAAIIRAAVKAAEQEVGRE